MNMLKLNRIALFLFIVLVSPHVVAEGLTKQQGDAILKELIEMRKSLQRIENRSSAAARKPAKTTAQVPIKNGSVIGDPKAPVTLVEFTDYECPYCARFYKNTFPQLKKKYIDSGKVRMIVKDLPLNFHKNARKAAQASRCAGEQGKFLEMHKALLNAGKNLEQKHLKKYAKVNKLNMGKFNSCLSSARHLKQIDKDTEHAQKEGITGTPTFVVGKSADNFIKGARIVGAQSIQGFELHINKILSN